eukprot:2570577-Rhodomonas_salina.3
MHRGWSSYFIHTFSVTEHAEDRKLWWPKCGRKPRKIKYPGTNTNTGTRKTGLYSFVRVKESLYRDCLLCYQHALYSRTASHSGEYSADYFDSVRVQIGSGV